jgi:hypothetical protein
MTRPRCHGAPDPALHFAHAARFVVAALLCISFTQRQEVRFHPILLSTACDGREISDYG